MKKLSFEQMEVTYGGKFIGVETSCGVCILGTQVCRKQGYVLWIPFGDATIYTQEC